MIRFLTGRHGRQPNASKKKKGTKRENKKGKMSKKKDDDDERPTPASDFGARPRYFRRRLPRPTASIFHPVLNRVFFFIEFFFFFLVNVPLLFRSRHLALAPRAPKMENDDRRNSTVTQQPRLHQLDDIKNYNSVETRDNLTSPTEPRETVIPADDISLNR